jgi:hypothetical protein
MEALCRLNTTGLPWPSSTARRPSVPPLTIKAPAADATSVSAPRSRWVSWSVGATVPLACRANSSVDRWLWLEAKTRSPLTSMATRSARTTKLDDAADAVSVHVCASGEAGATLSFVRVKVYTVVAVPLLPDATTTRDPPSEPAAVVTAATSDGN